MTRCRVRNESGQAAVEMALILPVLMLLLLGIMEFGQAWNAKQIVTDAAREGARQAVVWDPEIDQDSVEATVIAALGRGGIPSSAATVEFDRDPAPGGNWRNPGTMQTMDVRVQYRFGFFGPIFQAIFGSESVTLTSVVSMRNQEIDPEEES
jgi:Flp pilus assembly protein TadG